MTLKENSPYLGEEQQDGSLKINEHLSFKNNQWRRPDYDRFVSEVHQNEIDCLSVLIGIEGVEFCFDECSKLAQKRIFECKSCGLDYLQDPQWLACFEFKNLISDIREMMDLGKQSGALKQYDIEFEGALANGQDDFEFSFYHHYNVKEFLQWAMENSYPIPEEITSRLSLEGSNKRKETTGHSPKWTGQPIEKWENLSIILVSHDMVRVQTLHESKRMTFADFGMQDKRKGDEPKKVWETMKIFAQCDGIYPPDPSVYKENFPEKTKKLDENLRGFFGMTESIFKDHYHKHKKWETKIIFSSELELSRDKLQEKNPFDEELDNIAKDLNLDSPYQVEKP